MALGISERGRSVQLPDNSQINTLRDSSEQSYYAVICLRRLLPWHFFSPLEFHGRKFSPFCMTALQILEGGLLVTGWIVFSQKKMWKSWPPVPANSLFGDRVLADEQAKMTPLEWALIWHGRVLLEGGDLDRERCTQEEHHVKMKAEMGLMHLPVKEHQRLPTNRPNPGKGHRTDSPSHP